MFPEIIWAFFSGVEGILQVKVLERSLGNLPKLNLIVISYGSPVKRSV